MSKVIRVSKHAIEGIRNIGLRSMSPKRIKPRLVVLEVTDGCNSRCLQCNIWRHKPTSADDILSPTDITNMLKDPLFSNLEQVILTGGEPSIRTDLTEIIMAFYRHNPKMLIWYSTNGIAVHKIAKDVQFALNAGVRLGIGVSLDGVGTHHDDIRGIVGNFVAIDTLIDTLTSFKKIYPEFTIGIGFVLSDMTAGYYGEVKRYAESKGVDLVVQAYDESDYYKNTGVAKPSSGERVQEIVRSLPPSPIKEHWLKRMDGKPKTFRCFALCSFFFIHANGDVTPCLHHYDWRFGNIRRDKPSELWSSILLDAGRERVADCSPQCLNDWCVRQSLMSAYLPLAIQKVKQAI